MNLAKKKELAAKALKVGKNRICFSIENLPDIKEAITKEDIKGLYSEGIITIKPVKGRKKIIKRKTRRGPGKIKKKVNKRKQIYVKITRKLRSYLKELKKQGIIERDLYWDLRKKIRMRFFKSKAHLKEYLGNLEIKITAPVKSEKTKPKVKKINKGKEDEGKKPTKEKVESKEKKKW